MNQDALLKLIAETGYNVGFGAKNHLATFDIVEKGPGWIGFASFIVGLLALYVPQFEHKHFAATSLIIGVASLYINFYQNDKDKYAKTGSALTGKFHDLRVLYQQVKSQTSGTDLTPFLDQHNQIQANVLSVSLSKQIFLSEWYAHYKFFWEMQIDWVDEQLKFRFWHDKVPLGATLILAFVVVAAIYLQLPSILNHLGLTCR